MNRRLRFNALRILIAAVLLLAVSTRFSGAQCAAGQPQDALVQKAYEAHDWQQVIHRAGAQSGRSADVDFDYGMALAHVRKWRQAASALRTGERLCPKQKRFPIELAGVAFQEKQYPQAAAFLRRGLKLDPKDDYANDFAGTVYYLMGNLDAALHYWNRVQKPKIAALNLDSHLRIQRLLLSRAFSFSPAAVLHQSELETTEARLRGLQVFPNFDIAFAARPDGTFDANFHAVERDGFGSTPLQALVSTFGGLPYETVYPRYFNIRHEAINVDSLLRWDAQKRRVWIMLGAPLRNLPQRRWQLATDDRDENWAIRRSFAGTAPVLGSLNLETQTGSASVTSFNSGHFTWSLGAELSHRSFRNVVYGSALNPKLVIPGTQLKFLASTQYELLDLPEHRFSLTTGINSETGRLWSTPSHGFEKLQGSILAHWFPQAQADTYELSGRVRAGDIAGTAPFDELFMLGVERDNDLWLRGHLGTRDGRKGSSPLGTRYFLSSNDFYRSIYSNGLLTVQAGPLLDIGRMAAPTPGLSSSQWFFDSGIEAKLTVLGTHVVLTWGRDLRSGNNAFFGTAVP